MLELGPNSDEMHREAGRAIAASGVDRLVGVRGDARAMVEAAEGAGMAGRALFVETPEEAADEVASYLDGGDVVLVKGSRGVATDRAVARLVEIFGTGGEG